MAYGHVRNQAALACPKIIGINIIYQSWDHLWHWSMMVRRTFLRKFFALNNAVEEITSPSVGRYIGHRHPWRQLASNVANRNEFISIPEKYPTDVFKPSHSSSKHSSYESKKDLLAKAPWEYRRTVPQMRHASISQRFPSTESEYGDTLRDYAYYELKSGGFSASSIAPSLYSKEESRQAAQRAE